MTVAERHQVAAITIEQASGRVPVIINSGAMSTSEAIALSRGAARRGAAAVCRSLLTTIHSASTRRSPTTRGCRQYPHSNRRLQHPGGDRAPSAARVHRKVRPRDPQRRIRQGLER
jgi:hypothetical protein